MLSASGLRMTRQRQIILEELCKLKSHPTADELYGIVRKRLPKISLGTVYRNLEILSETGFAQKIDVGGTQKRFDGDTSNHYHIRCIKCHRVDDVMMNTICDVEEAVQGRTEFLILRHRLEFVGLCPKCQHKKA